MLVQPWMIRASVIQSAPETVAVSMKFQLQPVARRYAGFLLVFWAVVFVLWFFGAEIFSLLLQKSRAYTPPQFLTWLSLTSSLCVMVAFCVMPFSLFRIVRQRADA